jgi:hypothetical protein
MLKRITKKMATFDLYLQDEIASTQGDAGEFFGLIGGADLARVELYGYEITLSGRLTTPELTPRPEIEDARDLAERT